uniref:Uncharacterized protein n=1 Tax=Oryza nivara TaxID=4536 RepID=A0A0E0I1A8_ORYNI
MLAAVPDRPPLIRKRRVRPPPSKLEPRSHRPRSASRSVGGASWFFHGDPPSAIHGGKLAPVSIRVDLQMSRFTGQFCWFAG